jgi:hypothetical protein
MSSSAPARPLRWLIVGPFSAAPTGRITPVSGERFSTVMGKVGATIGIDVADHIGSESRRRIELSFPRLRAFRAADIIAADDLLRQLEGLADRLGEGRGAGDPAAAVERIVGPGQLSAALRADAAPEPADASDDDATTAASAPAAESASAPVDSVDAIFAKAAVAPAETSEAKSALDSFIGAVRAAKPASTPRSQRDRDGDAASVIRTAIARTVDAVLGDAKVADLEIAWRGLSMVVSAAPGTDHLAIDLLDADPATLAETIAHALDRPGLDRADAVFVTHAVGDTAVLARLMAVAADRCVPIAVEVPRQLAGLGPDDPSDGEPPEDWAQLRADPRARWLTAVANPPALYEEPEPRPRLRFGAAAAGIAAMAAAAVGRDGTPSDVLGRSGAWTAPAAHDVDIRGEAATIPTETFCTVADQQAAASRGLTLLGSEPGRPQLRLAACPTLGIGPNDPHLPGQILAGRAMRLARQVQLEHPAATPDELAAALAEASGRLIPNADTSAVALSVRTDGDQTAVEGSIGANLAGATFKFSSDV